MAAGYVTKSLKDGAGAAFTGQFWDDGSGNLFPVSRVLTASQQASASLARPADTNAYTVGDIIAASTTAATVNGAPTTITVGRANASTGTVQRAKLAKSGTSLTNAQFRVHLFASAPTVLNGDNGALSANLVAANYLGYFDVVMDVAGSDGCVGHVGAPFGPGALFQTGAASQSIYWLLSAISPYTPVSGETFTLTLDVAQD